MKSTKPIFLASLAALAGGLATLPARADDACKPITDVEAKMARTPYHEVATVDGKPFEKIYTTTTLSMRINNGKWLTIPMTPQEVLDAERETGSYSNCKMLRTEMLDGQRATVYAAQRTSPGTSFPNVDAQVWIGTNGLTLKTTEDTHKAGRTMHAESHVTYENVQAPAGAH